MGFLIAIIVVAAFVALVIYLAHREEEKDWAERLRQDQLKRAREDAARGYVPQSRKANPAPRRNGNSNTRYDHDDSLATIASLSMLQQMADSSTNHSDSWQTPDPVQTIVDTATSIDTGSSFSGFDGGDSGGGGADF